MSLSLSSSSMSDSASLSVCCLKGEYGGVMIFRRNDAIFTEIKHILVLTCTNRQSFTVARRNKNVLWLKWFILFHLVTSCLLAELYVDAQLFSCPVIYELYLVWSFYHSNPSNLSPVNLFTCRQKFQVALLVCYKEFCIF